jgi:hypothetical protein
MTALALLATWRNACRRGYWTEGEQAAIAVAFGLDLALIIAGRLYMTGLLK